MYKSSLPDQWLNIWVWREDWTGKVTLQRNNSWQVSSKFNQTCSFRACIQMYLYILTQPHQYSIHMYTIREVNLQLLSVLLED